MGFDREAIPAESRGPYKKRGIDPDQPPLVQQREQLRFEKQGERDMRRLEGNEFRRIARDYNAAEALNDAIERAIEKLPACFVDFPVRSGHYRSDHPVMVVQWSDHHANELINMGEVNKFDFSIYSKRLKKYVEVVKHQAESFFAERVVIAFGGDLINSDRLAEEKQAQATNRADAAVITADLLFQAVMDLRADYFVDVVAVVGNEGRIGEKQAFGKRLAKYNYDSSVLETVRALCERANPGDRGLRFYLGDQGINERTFSIHGYNFLLLHGNQGGVAGGNQKTVQAAIGKYAATKDIRIDKVLCGHIHSSHAGDYFSRNSSIAGSNDYSDSLQFASKAAQNLHIVTTAEIFSMVVDLQNTPGEGYPVEDLLRSFGVETADGHRLDDGIDDGHVNLT